jgi:hypothetical protein
MTVVETPLFLRKAAGLMTEEERAEMVVFVGANPEGGDVVPGTGGVRKLRWATRGRGKRGALRLIYCFHGEEFPVFLLTIYGKSQQANLTRAERNEMKKLVPSLAGGYWRGRQR